jgi:hypothetical protein
MALKHMVVFSWYTLKNQFENTSMNTKYTTDVNINYFSSKEINKNLDTEATGKKYKTRKHV